MVAGGARPKRRYGHGRLRSSGPVETGLIPRTALGARLYQRGQTLRGHGHLARVDLALNAPLRLPGPDTIRPKILRFASSLESLEKAFDAAKYGGLAQRPIMEAHLSGSETGAAPDGHEVVSLLVYFAPYQLKTGWTPEAGDNLQAAALSVLKEIDPDIREKLAAASVMTPVDLEREYSLVQGCLHHIEPSLDQMYFRPFVEASRVQGLLPGLHICGSGAHPVGGLTGPAGQTGRPNRLKPGASGPLTLIIHEKHNGFH